MALPPPPRNDTELALSPAMEDYLKSIYRLQEKNQRVTTQGVAERLKVAPASVTSMVKRLAERGLLTHERYRGVVLTEAGTKVAQEMIRHHRLLELYLTQALGFGEEEVHAEAERLEHFISEQLEDRIDEALGRPTCDPHGSPIPGRPGHSPRENQLLLSDLELYQTVTVLDAPESTACLGLVPGSEVTVLGRPRGAKVHLRVGGEECLVTAEVCAQVRVQR